MLSRKQSHRIPGMYKPEWLDISQKVTHLVFTGVLDSLQTVFISMCKMSHSLVWIICVDRLKGKHTHAASGFII